MSSKETTGRGRWREGRPASSSSRSPTRTSKWLGATLLCSLLLVVVGVLGWLTFQFLFPSKPDPLFVPFWIARYQKEQIAPIPGVEAERLALHDAGLFPRIDSTPDMIVNSTLEVMKTRLGNLRQVKTGETVVAYIAAYAMVDGTGDVQILASDSDPFTVKTMLPLRTVLTELHQCRARHKLLVLDIMRSSDYPLDLGGTPDGVADLIRNELHSEKEPKQPDDPALLVLTACSPGQEALWSENLGESAFGHFFHNAFTDPQADADHSNTISVKELASYVAEKVDRWANQFRGVGQRPYLVGTAADFDLATLVVAEPGTEPKHPVKAEIVKSEKSSETTKGADGKSVAAADKGGAGTIPGDKNAAKSKEGTNPSDVAAAQASESDQRGYPGELKIGWELREAWWKGKREGEFPGAAAPRVFRRLEAALLRAEQAWRGGPGESPVGPELKQTLTQLGELMDRATHLSRPQVRSVGQAKAFGLRADGELAVKIRKLLETHRQLALVPDPQGKAALEKAIGQIVEAVKLKANPPLELALAVVEGAENERLDASAVELLDGLLTKCAIGLDILELRILRDLARRAASAGVQGWSEETVKLAWNTVGLGEKVCNRPAALPWVRKLLEQAETSLHEARILLLFDTRDYVTWGQIGEAWEKARKELEFVATCQDKIEDAQTTLNQARAMLPAYLPFLYATRRPGFETSWLAVAKATVALDTPMRRSREREGEAASSLTREQLEQLNNELTAMIRDVRLPLEQLKQPFSHDSVSELIRQSEAVRPDPQVAAEIEAMLVTPFPVAADRLALWRAGIALDQRIAALPPRTDTPGSPAASETGRLELARAQVVRRATRLAALLNLTGADDTAKNLEGGLKLSEEVGALSQAFASESKSENTPFVQMWSGLARVAGLVYVKLTKTLDQPGSQDGEDRLGWIAPAFMVNVDVNPTSEAREREGMANWDWLAGRYRHQDRDLHEKLEPLQFYTTAAIDCPRRSESVVETDLELSLASDAPTVLSAKQASAKVGVQLLLAAAKNNDSQKVTLAVKKVDDSRFRAELKPPAELDLQVQKPVTATIEVNWNEDASRSGEPPPPGFLLEARQGDSLVMHLLVPVKVMSNTMLPRLVLSSTKGEPTEIPFDHFRLRTLPGRQSFYVFVKNPAPTPREVIVEVTEGENVLASSGAKPLPVAGKSTVMVPGFGAPVPKEGDPLAEAPTHLRLRLREGSAPGQEFDSQPLQPSILAPEEYVEVRDAQFIPADGGKPNQLRVTIRALPQMTGPPCLVELTLPKDRTLFPQLRGEPRGTLSGSLERGKELRLTAEGLTFEPGNDESGVFQISVDGFKRAFWYRTSLVEQGGAQKATEEREKPRVRFRPERIPGQPARLQIRFEVDKAPPDATLWFTVGRTENNKFVPDFSSPTREAKKRHVGFDPRGEGGALLFEASIDDWVETFDARGIRGKRQAWAFLRDGLNAPKDQYFAELVLDDLPPDISQMDSPGEIEEGTQTIDVSCTVTPSASRITEVAFVVAGKETGEADFAKAASDNKTIKGKKVKDDDQRLWRAQLTVPKDLTGKLVITARATSEVGLSGFASHAVTVNSKPVPTPAEVAAKDEKPKLGSIEGTVVEGSIAQSGLRVLLFDPKAKDPEKAVVKDATTGEDGSFVIKDVPPGDYILYCQKDSSKRLDRQPIKVEPGQVVRKKLELLL